MARIVFTEKQIAEINSKKKVQTKQNTLVIKPRFTPLSELKDKNSFYITSRLPTLNEIINLERANKFAAASLKKKYTDICCNFAMLLKNIINPDILYDLHIHYQVENNKTDADNIYSGGSKVILDGMQKAGIINGDGRKYIRNINNTIETGNQYFVKVTLIKVV